MANITWKRSTPGDAVIGASGADDWLAAINTAVTANAGDATFLWQVASYVSISPKSLLLKRKDGSAGRILLFGQQGSTAHANAVRGTPTASALYIAYSATSTSNTVDASWLAGAPLAASDYMPGVCCWATSAATYRFNYFDTDDGLGFFVSSTVSGYAMASAGNLVIDLTGTKLPLIHGSGTNWATSIWSNTAATGSVFDPSISTSTSYTTANAGMVLRYLGNNILVYRAFTCTTNLSTVLLNPSATKAYFFPVVIVGNTTDLTLNVLGKLNQIAMGPVAIRETTLTDGTTAGTAYGCSYQTSASAQAIWFTNTEI